LTGPDEKKLWTPKDGKDKFSFVSDEKGRVRFMVIHEHIYAPKLD